MAKSKKSNTSHPQIPDLTPETWELLENRMWRSLSKKIWALVGGLITVFAFAGYFGFTLYLSYLVEKQAEEHSAEYVAMQNDLKRDSFQLIQDFRHKMILERFYETKLTEYQRDADWAIEFAKTEGFEEVAGKELSEFIINEIDMMKTLSFDSTEFTMSLENFNRRLARRFGTIKEPFGELRTTADSIFNYCLEVKLLGVRRVLRKYAAIKAFEDLMLDVQRDLYFRALDSEQKRMEFKERHENTYYSAFNKHRGKYVDSYGDYFQLDENSVNSQGYERELLSSSMDEEIKKLFDDMRSIENGEDLEWRGYRRPNSF